MASGGPVKTPLNIVHIFSKYTLTPEDMQREKQIVMELKKNIKHWVLIFGVRARWNLLSLVEGFCYFFFF